MGIKSNKDHRYAGKVHESRKKKLESFRKELEDFYADEELRKIDSDVDIRTEFERMDVNYVNDVYDGYED